MVFLKLSECFQHYSNRIKLSLFQAALVLLYLTNLWAAHDCSTNIQKKLRRWSTFLKYFFLKQFNSIKQSENEHELLNESA